jgi:hypothetical protein
VTPRERRLRWATGDPLDLAVFRIAVSVVVLGSADVWEAHTWARAVVAPPAGWGLVGAWLPPSERSALVMTAVVLVAALLTLVGCFTRIAATVGALGLAWLLAVPQHSGQVLHTHHLVWFFALVAAGPSGDALSWDAWRAGRERPAPSLAHGLPVRFAWLAIGLLFFFPGAWKLHGGVEWLHALPALVEWKRFQLGLPLAAPLPALLLEVGGVVTVALELFVGVLFLFRRTRVVAACAGLVFHLGVQVVMGIGFSSLWACYVVFGDWARWAQPPRVASVGWRGTLPTLLVGGALVLAQVVTGVAGREDTWPVACYPTFRYPAPATVRWVEIDELDAHGAWRPALRLDDLRGREGQRWWGLAARTVAQPTREALLTLHRQWHGGEVGQGRYFVVSWRPGSSEPPRRSELFPERDEP